MTTRTTIDVDGTVTVRELTAEELAALAPPPPTPEQVQAGGAIPENPIAGLPEMEWP
jgi:hypothetical protein